MPVAAAPRSGIIGGVVGGRGVEAKNRNQCGTVLRGRRILHDAPFELGVMCAVPFLVAGCDRFKVAH